MFLLIFAKADYYQLVENTARILRNGRATQLPNISNTNKSPMNDQSGKKRKNEERENINDNIEDYTSDDPKVNEKITAIKEGLSSEQLRAFNIALSGKNLHVTGPAGTGKSTLIERMWKVLKIEGKKVAVTSLTGISASNISLETKIRAVTIHSWARITNKKLFPHQKDSIDLHVKKLKKKGNKEFRDRWTNTDVLIVDECSMMNPWLFRFLEEVARRIRQCNDVFGGMQVIFIGDWLQLEPIYDRLFIWKLLKLSDLAPNPDPHARFCFQLQLWSQIFPKEQIVVLKENHRQERDPEYALMLSKIREGIVDDRITSKLKERIVRKPTDIVVTCLYPRKEQVEDTNAKGLAELPGELYEFPIQRSIHLHEELNTKEKAKELEDKLKEEYDLTETLELKVGSPVLLRVNLDPSQGLANGSQGIVTGFARAIEGDDAVLGKQIPIVRFNNGTEISIDFKRYRKYHTERKRVEDRSDEDEGNEGKSDEEESNSDEENTPDPQASNVQSNKRRKTTPSVKFVVTDNYVDLFQLPLMLAFAITIHKCQSLTLDSAEADVGEGIFSNGQTYVALSRVREMKNLYLYEFDRNAVEVNRAVIKYLREIDGLKYPLFDRQYGRPPFILK